jgi:small subunit ribosomal protein S1
MSNPDVSEASFTPEEISSSESGQNESFDALFTEYERTHARHPESAGKQIEGTVVAVSPEQVFVDIGFKIEGVLPVVETEPLKPGDRVLVSIKGRNEEGYYSLSRFKVAQPKDWTSLEQAFTDKSTIPGRVTGVVKGGLSVDIGVRAFMPASRSGARDAAEMEKLIDQEIVCRIIKLDVSDEDVVVDRRAVMEEEARSTKERRYSEVKEGDVVTGTVRSLADYGAFVDLGGVDGLLHVGEISWSRINNPADVLEVGQQVEAKVLKIDLDKQRISLGMKQLQPHPWDAVPGKYSLGQRVTGVVTRTTDFGAFVELEPGIEGLIHISEMAWGKKVRKATDVVKPGEPVEAVILGIAAPERRISLGLKQAFGDPWAEAARNLLPGTQVEGPIVSFTKFGAFLQIAEGVEGMIHISEITAERRLNHPSDALRLGEQVKAQVLSIDAEKRQLRLSIKKLVPTGLDEFLAEHKEGDVVTGRLLDESGEQARVELGEGIVAHCRIAAPATEESAVPAKADLSSLTSMLQARWKGASTAAASKREPVKAGQIRSFRIAKLDAGAKKVELELA